MTGFPWIDAIMRQLRSEGWIHDIARRAVGSFLTRGCLWINWQEGFKVRVPDWIVCFTYRSRETLDEPTEFCYFV